MSLNGRTRTTSESFSVVKGKSEPTIWTFEKREILRKNADMYAWAKAEKESYIKQADYYVDKIDALYDAIVSEGIPRSMTVGAQNDPDIYVCRYCRTDLLAKYGSFPWLYNAFGDPWKGVCPECKRRFPSNDFSSYYKLGLNEYGEFVPSLAEKNNDELVKKGEKGYLVNVLYPEAEKKFGDANWGVDDGFGYLPGNIYPSGVVERHTYIASYLHSAIWRKTRAKEGVVYDGVVKLAYAYAYTNDSKYGRGGAVLLDRIADFYPGFDLMQWNDITWNSHGGTGRDKTIGCIWETGSAANYALSYDMLYPMYSDEYVQGYIAEKNKKYKMRNDKSSPAKIRLNIENGILRQIYKGCFNGDTNGNFGYPQHTLSTAAVVLDSLPETGEWIDFMMNAGIGTRGANVAAQLVNVIDRDGMGNEASSYNVAWLTSLIRVADTLDNCKIYKAANLYDNAKFARMFTAFLPLNLASYYSPHIGDSGITASKGLWMTASIALTGYKKYRDPLFAQILYLLCDGDLSNIHESITTENPEAIQREIIEIANKSGGLKLGSKMMTGFGFSVLRAGSKYDSADVYTAHDSQRDFWIYHGKNQGHGHFDTLNLGTDAFGLNIAPDLGYPEMTGTQPNRLQWVGSTLSHNTVMVNRKAMGSSGNGATPYHFDDFGFVKLMDLDAPQVYNGVDTYRRTLVMIEASDEVSYGVDFFRVKGGDSHLYSFHSQSDEIFQTEGLTLVKQNGGSYAGEDVPWGADPNSPNAWSYNTVYPRGFTWLDNVSRDKSPQSAYAVDFKVKDFNRVLPSARNLHLRMTMITDSPLNEVSIANGYVPNKVGNKAISNLKYVLAERTGSNLDTLFTTVFEPYDTSRYISSIERASVSGEGAQALKVTHTSGRVDYIVYSPDSTVLRRVDDAFDFKGFVGVYSVFEGKVVYKYVNDGETIGELTGIVPAASGIITGFTEELSRENSIEATINAGVSESELVGKYIYVDNDGVENGAYEIVGAKIEGNKVTLDIGGVSVIRAYKSPTDINAGYSYNIAEGQSYRIPLSASVDSSPVFDALEDKKVDANSRISFTVNARSPVDKALTYSAELLPRGADFDAEKRLLTWIPDSSQLGYNHISVKASDGSLESVIHIRIEVLGATASQGGNTTQRGDTSQTGGAFPPPVSTPRFSDLTGFEWAQDAINSLAEKGIIKGTSASTFSPGKSIIRADFVILLPRAFSLEGEAEQFSDVKPDDYFAPDLIKAKASGVFTGIGNNLANPRGAISREDMFTLIVRAMKLSQGDESALSAFTDTDGISPYARGAIAALTEKGIIKGSNGKIKPKALATRAEIAVLLARVLEN